MSKPLAAGVWYRLEKPFPCVTWREHSVQQVPWIQADVVENVIKWIFFFSGAGGFALLWSKNANKAAIDTAVFC